MGFRNQDTSEAALSMLNAIAQDIGLDMNRFAACLDKPATKNTVQLDIDTAKELGPPQLGL